MARKSNDGAIIVLLTGAVIGFFWSLRKYPIATVIGLNILLFLFNSDSNTNIMVFILSFFFVAIYGTVKLMPSVREKAKNDKKAQQEREEKFPARVIDKTKSLFERNADIITQFKDKVLAHSPTKHYSYANYYLDNLTRDCLNEICLAENQANIAPNSAYLIDWKKRATKEWIVLSDEILKTLKERQEELLEKEKQAEEEKRRVEYEKERLQAKIRAEEVFVNNEWRIVRSRKHQRIPVLSMQELKKYKKETDMVVDDIKKILKPNENIWLEKEKGLIKPQPFETKPYPLFKSEFNLVSASKLNEEIVELNKMIEEDAEATEKNKEFFSKIYTGYKKKEPNEVSSRIDFIINDIALPTSLPKTWSVEFDAEEGIAIIEMMLPDIAHKQFYKVVTLKSGNTLKPLNQREKLDSVPQIHPSIVLRIAYEIFRNDELNVINLLVVNGWVEFDDPNTGNKTKTYTASLVVEKDKIISLNLEKLEPLSAFNHLKGKSAGKLIDIVPITPILSMNRKDKRFIDTKEVLNKMGSETNLASIDWQEFESLIAELFEKEFASKGAEVKVTQASRDRGVDAVVFDPDPIKGGKFIIQAKRYTNTVDVSAVRDLCAVVRKEGASRGILVTTSTYGSDAYAFAQNEPITLLTGADLLGLLAKHGYKFRINLAEARKIYEGKVTA